MLSGLSDAVVGAIRRNTATSQSSSVNGEAVPDAAKTLEKSMEKVINHLTIMMNGHIKKVSVLSFDAFFSFFSLAKSPTYDLQITSCKNKIMICSCTLLSDSGFAANNFLLMRSFVHF